MKRVSPIEREIQVMGIVNITSDSYFAESRATDQESINRRIENLISQGADIIDIGACSTRPGSVSTSGTDEWKSLKLGLDVLKRYDTPLSIDTFRADIVERAYDMVGSFTVNDISAGEDDRRMLEVVGKLKLPYIAMHKRGTPLTMNTFTNYNNITVEIIDYFRVFEKIAASYGVDNYIIDPGFGFSKTVDQNYELLSNIDKFKQLDKKILIGISRKSMITKALDISTEEALPATSALHLYALLKGADILRVHDVKEAKDIIKLFSYLCQQETVSKKFLI